MASRDKRDNTLRHVVLAVAKEIEAVNNAYEAMEYYENRQHYAVLMTLMQVLDWDGQKPDLDISLKGDFVFVDGMKFAHVEW